MSPTEITALINRIFTKTTDQELVKALVYIAWSDGFDTGANSVKAEMAKHRKKSVDPKVIDRVLGEHFAKGLRGPVLVQALRVAGVSKPHAEKLSRLPAFRIRETHKPPRR